MLVFGEESFARWRFLSLNIHGNTLQHNAIHCNILQHTTSYWVFRWLALFSSVSLTLTHTLSVSLTLTHTLNCNVRDLFTSTHCNTLHALQHAVTRYNALQYAATLCNTLQHAATHTNLHCLGSICIVLSKRMGCNAEIHTLIDTHIHVILY